MLSNFKELDNFFYYIIGIILGIIITFFFYLLKRNHNNIFYIKLSYYNPGVSVCLFFIFLIITSETFHPLFLVFPMLFLLIINSVLLEYYKISEEKLYIKNGVFVKEKIINITEIKKIIKKISLLAGEVDIYNIIYNNETGIEIRTQIENRKDFFKKLLEINNKIELNISENIFDFIKEILLVIISIFFYTISFYRLIKTII